MQDIKNRKSDNLLNSVQTKCEAHREIHRRVKRGRGKQRKIPKVFEFPFYNHLFPASFEFYSKFFNIVQLEEEASEQKNCNKKPEKGGKLDGNPKNRLNACSYFPQDLHLRAQINGENTNNVRFIGTFD